MRAGHIVRRSGLGVNRPDGLFASLCLMPALNASARAFLLSAGVVGCGCRGRAERRQELEARTLLAGESPPARVASCSVTFCNDSKPDSNSAIITSEMRFRPG